MDSIDQRDDADDLDDEDDEFSTQTAGGPQQDTTSAMMPRTTSVEDYDARKAAEQAASAVANQPAENFGAVATGDPQEETKTESNEGV